MAPAAREDIQPELLQEIKIHYVKTIEEVLELAFFQDFACKEIAAVIGIPLGTVKSRLSYARRALKVALIRNGWEE